MRAGEPEARGAWVCPACGRENAAAAERCEGCAGARAGADDEGRACPACGVVSAAGAGACAACGWPFAQRRAPAPGLYMGRDAALHDAAAREEAARGEAGGWAWAVWIAVQVVCALVFVGFVVAVVVLRARPPGGVGLALLAVVLFVGARALWRFAVFLTAGREGRSGRPGR